LFYTQHALRAYDWAQTNYNLIEVFDARGVAVEIYVNIASPPQWIEGGIRFTDYELDVSKFPPAPARIAARTSSPKRSSNTATARNSNKG
jgi:protein associated with RNAse G/E